MPESRSLPPGGGDDSMHFVATSALICPPDAVAVARTSAVTGSGTLCIGKYEVTVEQYRRCVAAGQCVGPFGTNASGSSRMEHGDLLERVRAWWNQFCVRDDGSNDSHPMNCIDHERAQEVCAYLGGRLPNESEWISASGIGSSRRYPWGNSRPSPARLNAAGMEFPVMWYTETRRSMERMYRSSDGFAGAAPIHSFPTGDSPDGIADLDGNVSEWLDASTCRQETAPGERVATTYCWTAGMSFGSTRRRRAGESPLEWKGATGRYASVGARCVFEPSP